MEDKKQTRLESEYQRLLDMKSQSDLFDFEALQGSPPRRYRMSFKFKGIMLHPESNLPCITLNHVMEVYLPPGYPAEPPYIRWMTSIFHPNISKNGTLCIGDWAPSLNLAWLVEQVSDMITYRSYNIDDPWNKDAAAWATENTDKFPADTRTLYRSAAPVITASGKGGSSEQMKILDEKITEPVAQVKPDQVIPVVELSHTTLKVSRIRLGKPGSTHKSKDHREDTEKST